jgi:ribosomal protein S18 acetylase RimI-like enzyme
VNGGQPAAEALVVRQSEAVVEVRQASPADADMLTALDEVARRDVERAAFIRRAIESGLCLVAVETGEAIGYAVATNRFFGHVLVEMLYVDRDHRRRRIGTALMTAVEGYFGSQKLFVSTNQSNTAMQALLASLEYQRSGVIENLDEGDPELIYVKQLGQSAV